MTSHKTYVQDCLAAFKIIEESALTELAAAIETEKMLRQVAKKNDALDKIRELMAQAGLKDKDLKSMGKTPSTKSVLPIKFKHPSNPRLVWSGHGRQPDWVKSWAAEHGDLEALRAAA